MKLLAAVLALALGVIGVCALLQRSPKVAILPAGPPAVASSPTPAASNFNRDQLTTSWSKSSESKGAWLEKDARVSDIQAASEPNSAVQSQLWSDERDRRDPSRVQRREQQSR